MTLEVRGSVLVNVKAGKMGLGTGAEILREAGIQKPEFYEEVLGTKVFDFLESKSFAGFEQSGQSFTNTQTDEEALEVNWLA